MSAQYRSDCPIEGIPTQLLAVSLEQIRVLPRTAEQTVPQERLDEPGDFEFTWHMNLFNQAMVRLFQITGLTVDHMNENQSGSFALENHMRHYLPVRGGDRIAVHTQFLDRSEKRMHIMHYLINESRERFACTVEVVTAHVDMRTRKMSAYPQTISDRVDALISDHQALGLTAPVCGMMRP